VKTVEYKDYANEKQITIKHKFTAGYKGLKILIGI
jgi:hypothetical protein